ncbi:ubiquitin-related domain-containing protein [Neohortaea acidophila]|uniref:Ubiquitin-related domain-containing protein n=1 Tax=Neohortaea acidophila TaxID=245834 RepID=A0A6A6PGM4_9PEZI|nr:ubiquitin-related domain-containing protein [Neohortaea acidophila]KAF2479132.1 ubiquitin-related domain-containing protein [Neohortaea acidophila]
MASNYRRPTVENEDGTADVDTPMTASNDNGGTTIDPTANTNTEKDTNTNIPDRSPRPYGAAGPNPNANTATNAVPNANAIPNASTAAGPAPMSIRVSDAAHNELAFRLKPNTPLSKVMESYSSRTSRDRRTLRFLFEGVRVTDESTPASLEMEDNDMIEVYMEQLGGGNGW